MTPEHRDVTLDSGGVVTLTASGVPFLTLSTADRDFVIDLLERIDDYEARRGKRDAERPIPPE